MNVQTYFNEVCSSFGVHQSRLGIFTVYSRDIHKKNILINRNSSIV